MGGYHRPRSPHPHRESVGPVTPADAKRFVVVGTVGAGTLSAIASFRRGAGVSPRLAVGVFAAGTILAVGAEVAPAIAGGMAVLMLVTAAFVLGGDAWAGITAATSTTTNSGDRLGGSVATGVPAPR